MLYRVFNERLERKRRNANIVQRVRYGDGITQARAETGLLNFEIVANDFEFLAERHQAAVIGVEREAEQRGQLADSVFSSPGVSGNERGDGVESIEEEVGMDARFERR